MRVARRTSFFWALMLAAFLAVSLPGIAHAAKTITLSSGTFEFTVDAGGKGEGEVIVGNDGDEPLKALVYVSDVTVDIQGEQTFTTPQREGASLMSTPASWFRIYMPADSKSVANTPYLELDPGERVTIRFEFTPPSGTAPGDHNTVILFEMFEFPDGSEGSTAMVGGRLGARVALRVEGKLVDKLAVRPFDVPQFVIGGKVPFTFTLRNEGNINKRISVMTTLLDRSERAVAETVVTTDTAMYADTARQFTGALVAPGGRIGPHTVELVVEHLDEDAQIQSQLVEQRTVWILPFWIVVLIGFLITYAFAYIVYRVRRKRHVRTVHPSPSQSLGEMTDNG